MEPKLDATDGDKYNEITPTATDITYDENGNITINFRFDANQ